MKLVANWKDSWKWFSTWAMGLPASLAAVWLLIPDKVQDVFLANVTPRQIVIAVLVILVIGLGGRYIDQSKSENV